VPARRARAKYTFYRFYTAPCGAPHTTPADLGISINLFFWLRRRAPLRLHAFTELAKHKGFGVCVMYSSPFLGYFNSYQERYSCREILHLTANHTYKTARVARIPGGSKHGIMVRPERRRGVEHRGTGHVLFVPDYYRYRCIGGRVVASLATPTPWNA
jgi:hypothetical protein